MESQDLHTPAGHARWHTIACAIVVVVLAAAACRPANSVRIAWDAPTPAPKGYRILVDDREVMNIAPPPLDRSCSCPAVWVPVPPGDHTITVIAYNQFGNSAPAAITSVRR